MGSVTLVCVGSFTKSITGDDTLKLAEVGLVHFVWVGSFKLVDDLGAGTG